MVGVAGIPTHWLSINQKYIFIGLFLLSSAFLEFFFDVTQIRTNKKHLRYWISLFLIDWILKFDSFER